MEWRHFVTYSCIYVTTVTTLVFAIFRQNISACDIQKTENPTNLWRTYRHQARQADCSSRFVLFLANHQTALPDSSSTAWVGPMVSVSADRMFSHCFGWAAFRLSRSRRRLSWSNSQISFCCVKSSKPLHTSNTQNVHKSVVFIINHHHHLNSWPTFTPYLYNRV